MNDSGEVLQFNPAADARPLAGIAQLGLALPGGPEDFFLMDDAGAPGRMAARYRAARLDDYAHAVKMSGPSVSAAEAAGPMHFHDWNVAAMQATVGLALDEVKTRARSGLRAALVIGAEQVPASLIKHGVSEARQDAEGMRAGWRACVVDGKTLGPVEAPGDAGQKAPAAQPGPDPAPSACASPFGYEADHLIPSQPAKIHIKRDSNDIGVSESGVAQLGAQIGGGSPSVRSGRAEGWSGSDRAGWIEFGGGAGGVARLRGVASTRWVWLRRFLNKKDRP